MVSERAQLVGGPSTALPQCAPDRAFRLHAFARHSASDNSASDNRAPIGTLEDRRETRLARGFAPPTARDALFYQYCRQTAFTEACVYRRATQMRDRQSQRVGGIRSGHFGQVQQHFDHVGDLRLLGPPTPRQRLLDARRRILCQLNARALQHQQHHAPRVSELRCGLCILVKEQAFYRAYYRLMTFQ